MLANTLVSGELLQCKQCDYKTAYSSHLTTHFRKHSDEVKSMPPAKLPSEWKSAEYCLSDQIKNTDHSFDQN